jgi:1,4-dihydroxy-6-naphthoate synthase
MFWGLASGRVPTGDRRYVHELADIETLNRRALAAELEVTAVSLHAYAYLAGRYALLAYGGSVGDGYGPRVVSRAAPPVDPRTALRGRTVAVPGELTTAFLVLRLYQPDLRTTIVPFDQIDDAVASGAADFGLLIHEGQLTHAEKGLALWVDLGEWWHGETGLPLPLGGNVARRDLGDQLIRAVAGDLRASIAFALANRADALEHAARFGRGLDDVATDRFVGMYVNEFTLDYGPRGRRAIGELLERGYRAGILPRRVEIDFVG